MTGRTDWAGVRPSDWAHLITELERIKAETGWGMAATWALVNKGEYSKARARLEQYKADEEAGR
jgi:hypothetical protein